MQQERFMPSITHILRGIGFTEKQIEYQKKKMMNDVLLRNNPRKFSGVDLNMPNVNEITCISNRKLPIALAKITITPKMKHSQPELSERLLRYQDKCADVLAEVFIDNKSADDIGIELLEKKLDSIMNEREKILLRVSNPVLSEYKSKWLKNTLSSLGKLKFSLGLLKKLNSLPIEFMPTNDNISFSWTIHLVITHAEEINKDISFKHFQRKFQSETGCIGRRVLDFIEYYQETKDMFTEALDSMMNIVTDILKTSVNIGQG